MVLDEEALEAMLARGRAAEGKTERPKMELADQSDHFEVYERKQPRADVEPGPVEEPTQAPAEDDFEVYGEPPQPEPQAAPRHEPPTKPEPQEPAHEEASTEPAWEQAQEPTPHHTPGPAPQTEPVAAPSQETVPGQAAPQRRRPEVWPPIRRSHAPEQQPPAAPTEAPRAPPAPTVAAQDPATPQATAGGHARGVRLAILQSTFNEELTGAMAKLAKDTAAQRGATVTTHATVPGVYDMPLVAKHLLAREDVDGLVVLGVVVKGETQHDELITFATAKTLQEVSLAADKPIGLGITGPGMTWDQADARVGNAAHAVDAVLVLLRA